ncbi:MAG: portal protein [Actinomycetota bacterium]
MPLEKDWLALAGNAYEASTTYMDAYLRPEWERSLKQWQGRHAADSKYTNDAYKGRSKMFRPKTRGAIRKNEAMAAAAYFSTQDVVSITPTDDSQVVSRISAELHHGLLNYRLTHTIPWFMLLIGAYQEAQVMGAVCSHQYWEYDPQRKRDRPWIELIPLENMRIDAGASWLDPINTSPYLIRLMPMYLGEVKRRMSTPDPKTGKIRWLPVSEGDLMSASKEHWDSTRMTRERRNDPKAQDQAVHDFSIVWVRQIIVEQAGNDWIYYTAGGEHLLSEPVALEEAYFHGMRPYVMGTAVLEAHRVFPSSIPELTKDIAAEINEVTNQRLDNVKFVLNKRYFARRDARVDTRSLTRNVPGSVTLMNDPQEDVHVVSTPDVTGSSFQEQDRLNLDFDEVAGTFSNSSIASNRNLNETVGGLNLLTTGANQMSEYQLRTFTETWTERVLRQMVALEREYETDPLILAIAGRQSKLLQKLGLQTPHDALLGAEVTVSVNVGMSATNPQLQVERFFMGLEKLGQILGPSLGGQLNLEEVVKEAFGKLGYKDGMRFFGFDEEDPRVSMLTQQIQELQQQLAAKRSPELEAAQVKKLEAETERTRAETVGKGVDALFSAMQGAQVVATVPGVTPIADELLASSGWVDKNGPPLAPPYVGPALAPPDVDRNTSPMFPPRPDSPMEGIETPEGDLV